MLMPRTIAEVRERATDLSSKVSSLAQQVITIEDELANIHRMGYEDENYPGHDKVIQLNKTLDELESDKLWMETTLEALEWVLGETDVKAEDVSEEECRLITSSTK